MSHLPCQMMPRRRALLNTWQSFSQGVSGHEVGNAMMAYDRLHRDSTDMDPPVQLPEGRSSICAEAQR